MAWEPDDRVSDAFRGRFFNVDAITPIVVFRWAKVPAINCMRSPCASDTGLLVDHNACACRSEGRAIKIERSMELCVRREAWINARRSQQIERDEGLGQ